MITLVLKYVTTTFCFRCLDENSGQQNGARPSWSLYAPTVVLRREINEKQTKKYLWIYFGCTVSGKEQKCHFMASLGKLLRMNEGNKSPRGIIWGETLPGGGSEKALRHV